MPGMSLTCADFDNPGYHHGGWACGQHIASICWEYTYPIPNNNHGYVELIHAPAIIAGIRYKYILNPCLAYVELRLVYPNVTPAQNIGENPSKKCAELMLNIRSCSRFLTKILYRICHIFVL